MITVQIWSDVMCPFCYIGKRRFEIALGHFQQKDEVAIEWKSFQLDPLIKTNPVQSVNQYLAERKGWSLEYAQQVNNRVTTMAYDIGLRYDFDRAVVANSFDAHRLSHFAKKYNLQNLVEELLFKAYFTDGKNIADHGTLIQLAIEAGLRKNDVQTMLSRNEYADDVIADINEARQIGVQGVPFFVFNRKYAVTGAQPSELFLEVLHTVSKEPQLSVP